MRIHKITALLFGAASLFSSCHEIEHHYTAIFYPEGLISEVFADECVDSVKFVTFDDWSLSVQPSAPWASLSNDEDLRKGSVPEGSYVRLSVPVFFEPNTSGEERTAQIDLSSYGKTLSAFYVQHQYHNITRPVIVDSTKSFVSTCSLTGGNDSIVFTAYQPWKLSFENSADASWITVEQALKGSPGRQALHYTVLPADVTISSRTARLILESAGVKTPISIVCTDAK